MATIGDIKIRIGGDIKSLEKSLKRAEFRLQRSGRKMAELGGRLSAAITLPILAIGGASLKIAGDMQALKMGMESMMGSAEAAKVEIAKLRKEALLPGLNFEQALKGSVRLQAVGVDADIARRALAGFGNALALVGGTGEQLDGVTLALSQIAAKGKISAEEINQLAERVPQIRSILKNAFGTADTEELQKLGIGFEEFVAKSIIELEKLPKAQSGIKNSIENTKLALQEAAAVIGERLFPIFEKISAVVLKIATAFTRLPPNLQDNIIQFGLLAAVMGPVLSVMGSLKIAAGTLVGSLASLTGVFSGLAIVNGKGLRVFKLFSAAITFSLNPLTFLFGAISRLKLPLLTAQLGFLKLGRSIKFASGNPIAAFRAGLASIAAALSSITIPFGLIAAAVAAFAVAVVVNIGPARKKFVELANTFIDLYNESKLFRGIIETLSFAFNTLYTIANSVLQGIWQGVKSIGSAIVALFKGDIEGIKTALLGGFDGLKVIGDNAGKEIAEAFKKSIENTVGDRPKLDFITEKDVDATIKKASDLAKKIQEKLFGVALIDDKDNDKKDLDDDFDRAPKGSGGGSGKRNNNVVSGISSLDLIPDQITAIGNKAAEFFEQRDFTLNFKKHIDSVGKRFAHLREEFNKTTNEFKEGVGNILESGIESGLAGIGESIGNIISGTGDKVSVLAGLLATVAGALEQLGKLAIATGIAMQGIRKAFTNPFAAIAAGIGLIALSKIVSAKAKSLTAPKLAKGGLAYGETLATVGDNPNARIDPEVIAPLSKLKDMLGSPTVNVQVTGEGRLRGTDIVYIYDAIVNQKKRYGIG